MSTTSPTIVPLPPPSARSDWRTPSHAFGDRLSPELELILCAASPLFDDSARARVQRLLHSEWNRDELARLALGYGLSPLLYTRLHSVMSHYDESLSELKADALALVQRALVLTTEMKRLIPHLEAKGIETLVFKGPALARVLYANPSLRAFTDLDVMVRPEKAMQAWALLAGEGYTLEYKFSREHLPALLASGNHLPLHGSPNNELIELHWAFFPRSRATPFDTAGAWTRRIPLCFDDMTIMTLAPRDLVHFLCLHGTKHAWCRLGWVADLAWFVFRYPSFEWDELLEHATRLGTRRMTLVGLTLARELFRIQLAARVTAAMHQDSEVLSLARWMWQRLLSGVQDLPTGPDLLRLVLHSRERRRDRARDVYYHIVAPRPGNLDDLPHSAATLHTYTLHRLWYLLLKYGRTHM